MNSATHLSGSSRQPRATSELTAAQRWLVEIMSEYQFGRFEDLRVQSGQPAPDPRLKVIRVARLGAKAGDTSGPKLADDFVVKQAIEDLFNEFARIGNGVVRRLEFRYGLPCLVETTVASNCDSVPRSGLV
jgi:hypothetical protein